MLHSSVFIHSIYNSLHLLIPNSLSIPLPALLKTTDLVSISESVSAQQWFSRIFFLMSSLGSVVKNLPDNAGDLGSIPGSGISPGKGNGNPLQYSCLENPHGQRSLACYSPQGHKRVRHDWAAKLGQHSFSYYFPYSFPLWVITRNWIWFSVLYKRTLLSPVLTFFLFLKYNWFTMWSFLVQ